MDMTRWCRGCAAETAYVRFDCTEHPEDCVELVCELCGAGFELAAIQVAGGTAAAAAAAAAAGTAGPGATSAGAAGAARATARRGGRRTA
ncbi:MAG TPA: hypothetical protein VF519_18585 [Mycobacteriales bacterium]|jgi:hypothetical protein